MYLLHFPIFPKTKGAYVVGGSVRDLLLDRDPMDYDIAVLENPEQFAEALASQINGRVVRIGKPEHDIYRVITHDKAIDVTRVYGETIEKDLLHRDFTINAMAYELSSGRIIDPLGGLEDLKKKCVRMVSKGIFQKDPVRLMRAYRISALLDFHIEPQTLLEIGVHAQRIRTSPGERIRQELLGLLRSQDSYPHVEGMIKTGLLSAIIPEFEKLKGCVQNRYHDHDVLDHTLMAFHHLEQLLCDAENFFSEKLDPIKRYATEHRKPLLKWAILLHDIGKPMAQMQDSDGITHFYGHARKSAEIAADIVTRLRFSNQDLAFTSLLIRQHMRPFHLFSASLHGRLSRKAYTRFFLTCGRHTPGVLLNAIADTMGKRLKPDKIHKDFIQFAWSSMQVFFSEFCPQKCKPPLITGHDLIQAFDLAPSPRFKKILRAVEEARLAKTIFSRSDALRLAENLIGRSWNKSDKP